ncbi:MAG: GNAT family N-acetyltransferase [Halodesulfurarchaeum sp.]
MHVRDAKNREEVWLLDRLEEFGFQDPAFRSRDYVLAVDEHTGTRTGFGRIRVHRGEGGEVCELTCIGVLPDWRGQGIGAHIVERLLEQARDQGFEAVFSLAPAPDYLSQFGFERVGPDSLPPALRDRFESVKHRHEDAAPTRIDIDEFRMPRRLRDRFRGEGDDDSGPQERPEDFGIDPETASYKYEVND